MKLFFISLSLLFSLSCFLYGQTIDFAPLGAKWYFSVSDLSPPPPNGEFPHVIEVESIEMYHGKLCSKLVNISLETVPDPLYIYTQNDSVFFYSLLSGQFELLYDFCAEAGDTWTIGGLGKSGGYDSLSVWVDSVSTLNMNGIPLKVLHISFPLLPYEWGYEIVEGIGNTFFLTPDWGLYEGGPKGLRCFSVGDTTFQFVPYPCDTTILISGVEQITNKTSSISISPNPSSDHIYIQVDTPVQHASFFLFDQSGRLVLITEISQGNNEIILPAIFKGHYFWKVMDVKGPVSAGNILIL
jgi:hypothetical protein